MMSPAPDGGDAVLQQQVQTALVSIGKLSNGRLSPHILHRTIMDQLEEHVPSKLQNSENLVKFRNYVEKNDFIRLLPGTVPAFALRNRKWCLFHTRQALTMSGLTHSQSCSTSSGSRSSSSLVTGADLFCPMGTRK